jgi:hypothetical protein
MNVSLSYRTDTADNFMCRGSGFILPCAIPRSVAVSKWRAFAERRAAGIFRVSGGNACISVTSRLYRSSYSSMKSETRKELVSAYLERKVVGGVFAIRNTEHGKRLLNVTSDVQGSRNRFDFMKNTGVCYHHKLRREWSDNPPFVFEVLEELEKGETQTDSEFDGDLETLRELWLDKLRDGEFY